MKYLTLLPLSLLIGITGCASMKAPTSEQLSRLPVETYPAKPSESDFIYKLPAGVPISANVIAKGSLLATGDEKTLAVTLKHDLYIHKRWLSEDKIHWQRAQDLVAINLALSLPSDQHPGPGELSLQIDRKESGQ